MKTMLNCDDVFDALTSGPVQEGSDAAMEQHLAQCHQCRALAEALRPASHLIHESLPEELRMELPVFLADHDVAVQRIMERIQPIPLGPRVASWLPAPVGVALVAALAIVLMICLLPATGKPVGVAAVGAALESLRVPDPCIQLVSKEGTAHASVGKPHRCEACHDNSIVDMQPLKHRCCTECHTATRDKDKRPVPVGNLSQLVAACVTCH